jgi:hypothetical protein
VLLRGKSRLSLRKTDGTKSGLAADSLVSGEQQPGVQAGRFPENREFNREFSIFRLVQQGRPGKQAARLPSRRGLGGPSSGAANATSLRSALP